MQALEVRDYEIEQRLESFARARLSPDPQAVARARARILREARLQFDAARIATHVGGAVARSGHRAPLRRVAMPLLAAAVWLGIAVGSISAAQAGGPLYSARVWVENATLPASGPSRTNAELSRLDARLADAMNGAARGDAGAVTAALDAYRQIADETTAAAAGDLALENIVAAALDQHRAVLTVVASRLEEKGNDTAAQAVEASIRKAIDHNQAVVDRLGSAGKGGGSTGSGINSPASGGNGGTGGTGPGAANGGAGGAGRGIDKPAKSSQPTANPPKATPSPPKATPDATPQHTPRSTTH